MYEPPTKYLRFMADFAARLPRLLLCVCLIIATEATAAAAGQPTRSQTAQQTSTTSPMKHVIVIVGENRSFDHIFGLYRPHQGQSIWNLLSNRIVNADGTPGPNFTRAAQFQVPSQTAYYIGAPAKMKYASLPPPVLDGAPATQRDLSPPFKSMKSPPPSSRTWKRPANRSLPRARPAPPKDKGSIRG
jgi:phosphoesterase family protein